MEDSRESAEQISSYAEERSLFMNKDLKYENYLTQPNSLPVEEAMEIYEAILQNSPEDDEEFEEFWELALSAMTVYADLRANWKQIRKGQRDNDGRTRKHDNVIHTLNLLSGMMEQRGLDVSWRKQLGDQRKRIGDFACYVAMLYGLSAR